MAIHKAKETPIHSIILISRLLKIAKKNTAKNQNERFFLIQVENALLCGNLDEIKNSEKKLNDKN